MSHDDAMLLTGLRPSPGRSLGRVSSTPLRWARMAGGSGWRGIWGRGKSADPSLLSEQHQTPAGHNRSCRFRRKLESVGPDRDGAARPTDATENSPSLLDPLPESVVGSESAMGGEDEHTILACRHGSSGHARNAGDPRCG
jgi:hypothetical protein